jgi:uncharacterized membrane protein YfcA
MGQIIGGTLIVGGFGFLAKTFLKRSSADDDHFAITPRVRVLAMLIGGSFGFVVGLTSVGSGTFFGLALLLLFPLSATRMVGTDMLHAALLLWVAGAGHLLHGNVDLHAIAWLLIGSIPGVLLGSNLSITVPERALRAACGLTLTLSGVKLVHLPEATLVIESALLVAAAALVTWVALRLRRRRRARMTAALDGRLAV